MAAKRRVSDQLRQAIRDCGKTRYRISVETGISESILSRFLNRGAGLSLANIDLLCESIGAELELKPKSSKRKKK
jgi:hypothetical protein